MIRDIIPGVWLSNWQELCYECSNPIQTDLTACTTCGAPQVILKDEIDAAQKEQEESIWSDIKRDLPRVYYVWHGLCALTMVGFAIMSYFFSWSARNAEDYDTWMLERGAYYTLAYCVLLLSGAIVLLVVHWIFLRYYFRISRDKRSALRSHSTPA